MAARSEVLKLVDEILPPATPGTLGSSIRRSSDAVKIATALALNNGRATEELARRFNVSKDTLKHFRRNYVTPNVIKAVKAHSMELQAEAHDKKIIDVQQAVHGSLIEVAEDLKYTVARIKDILERHDGDAYLERLGPLVKTLDIQGKNAQRMADSFAKLDREDISKLPLNRHPEAAKLAALLALVFEKHPEARDTFLQMQQDMNTVLT